MKLSPKQNNSLNLYCRQLSEALNSGGYSFKKYMNSPLIDEINLIVDWLDMTPLSPDNLRRQLMKRLKRVGDSATTHDLWWTEEMAKNYIWRRIQIIMFDIESTTAISPTQCTQVYEQIAQLMAERFGIDLPWPSNDNEEAPQ